MIFKKVTVTIKVLSNIIIQNHVHLLFICFDTLLLMFFSFETAMAYNTAISYICTTNIESLTFEFTNKSSKLLP